MTQMQIGRLTHGPEHRWAVLALEDGGRQLRLSLRFAWPEANRLARELGLTRFVGEPSVNLGILGDLLAPWFIRYLAAGFAWLQLAAWGALWLGGGTVVGLSLWECLAGPRR